MKKASAASLLILLCLCAKGASGGDPVLSLQRTGNREYHLQARLTVDAPVETVWAVLTDYDHLDNFIASLKRSSLLEKKGKERLVEQESVGRFFIFQKTFHLLLRVREEPRTKIEFYDISKRDFDSYQGSWRLEPLPGKTVIIYDLQAAIGRRTPRLFLEGSFRKTATQLLREIEEEIRRRSASIGRSVSPPTPLLHYSTWHRQINKQYNCIIFYN